ncbi:MAG: M4 family metallopeptidase, partial [Myxococcota bacterium]
MRVAIDELNMAHTRVQQTQDGIPVFGGEAIIHPGATGNLRSISERFVRSISADSTPELSDLQAIDLALASSRGWDALSRTPTAELFMLRHQDRDYLSYKVDLFYLESPEDPTMPVIFINAKTGAEIMRYDNLQTARDRRIYDANNRMFMPGQLRISEGQGEIYQGESGALNEATSDILTAAIEAWARGNVDQDVWHIGEDCWLSDDALRFMDNPSADDNSRDHYQDRYIGREDNGGVHYNSGIGNLFFYLLSQGGDHPNPNRRVATVTGIGIEQAAAIWYRALTIYMTSSTDFAGARTATENACADLYSAGSMECKSVGAA